MKVKKNIRALVVRLMYVMYALKNINKPHLGDVVTYKGLQCMLIQGVQNPFWDLWYEGTPIAIRDVDQVLGDDETKERLNHIHKDDFKLQPLWKRFKFSFLSSYEFQMSNWYSIDVQKSGKISYR